MTLCHIVSHIDEEASGPSYSVPRLARAVAAKHCQDVVLATLDRGAGTRDLGEVTHLAFSQKTFPRKLGLSPSMNSWLKRARANGISLIHSHGLWMMPNIYPARAAARAGIPHVIAPRGTLDPAALIYSREIKKVACYLGQGAALRAAAALHATSEDEARHIRAQGLRQPIILSPNGIDVPRAARPPRGPRRTLLYLGRLHEKKGLDMLLVAWTRLERAHPDWDLRIIGSGSKIFEDALAEDVARFGLTRVVFDGTIYGSAKLEAFQAADLFVLPTRGENFGMVVAESLAAGTPVVTTMGAPWEGLTAHRAGWRCAPEPVAIEAALAEALRTPRSDLEAMGARGRDWMARAYSWDAIGLGMAESYCWILNGGNRPQQILTD